MKLQDLKGSPLYKGWSHDKKYTVDYEGTKALLRVSSISKQSHRQAMVDAMNDLSKCGVPLCKPLMIDSNEETVSVLFEWIEGEDLKDIIHTLTPRRQYELGLQAGRYLLNIHTMPIVMETVDWETIFTKKMNRKIDLYHNCTLKYDDASLYLNAISNYIDLLRSRPTSFQHGDYHIGNIMISNNELIIIDFDRWDYGDPWEEFNRIVWSAQTSPEFATGMIDGYFQDGAPEDFWKLLLLYISSNMLSSLPWAHDFGESEVATILNQHKDILSWYHLHATIPSWYQSYRKNQ